MLCSLPPRCHGEFLKKIEYLVEIKTEFENILTCLSGRDMHALIGLKVLTSLAEGPTLQVLHP